MFIKRKFLIHPQILKTHGKLPVHNLEKCCFKYIKSTPSSQKHKNDSPSNGKRTKCSAKIVLNLQTKQHQIKFIK